LSLLDSATKFQDYIDRAVQLGQTAIAFTEHGNIYQWVAKKMACDKAGIKYLHGVECYLTEQLYEYPDANELWREAQSGRNEQDAKKALAEMMESGKKKVRDNYHTILIAKNYDGILEINNLVSLSNRDDHFYYKPRITFEEFLGISDNVIKISACLASPLNKMSVRHPMYEKLLKHYDYLEVQAHNFGEQISYNCHLAEMSKKYGIPLIAGTDTHSIDAYKAECRSIMQLAKHIEFADEDSFDLTYKTYDELVEMFRIQGALPEQVFLEAIENTNRMADSVEPFELDISFKYPKLYGNAAEDKAVFEDTIRKNLQSKIDEGAITPEQIQNFKDAIKEECRVFDKIDMSGFMLFMSELVTWCKSNGIPIGFNRGSCGGSRVAYVTNTTDLNPETWHTVFSRFCNEDRKEIGDIDIDVSPSDRDKVYGYIINRFGQEKTAFILAIGTIKSKGCIDEICRALGVKWNKEHQRDERGFRKALELLKDNSASVRFGNQPDGCELYHFDENGTLIISKQFENIPRIELVKQFTKEYSKLKEENEKIFQKNPWVGKVNTEIKDLFELDEEKARSQYPEVFYYYDGLLDVAISQSMHPAGIVASPITLRDHYGTFLSEGKEILQIDMECVHEAGLVKYDILGLKNIEIIKDTYALIGKPYPKSHEINWNDDAVWNDMLRSPIGIFQFESAFAFDSLRKFKTHSIYDMSLVTACIRPSGASYRDELLQRKPHHNPSPIIDDLLKDNLGYLIYQEDTIKFLQQICGLSGSEADNVRRAIGRKQKDRLEAALPDILEGYCSKSSQPRNIAEEEAKEFLQIIEDSASYQFGYNHSIGYCMIGYLCAYLRYYYPAEFITAYLNNANNEDDIKNGSALAELYGIQIVPPRYGISKDRYVYDKDRHVIAKGINSIKYMNSTVANELYDLAKRSDPKTFMSLLTLMNNETSIDTRQRDILIKIDFFVDFGNATELSRIASVFAFFKNGTAKKVQKDKISGQMLDVVSKYATNKNKNGTEAKSFTITDMAGLLDECEDVIKSLHLPDLDLKCKIQNQIELMGYIDLTTNKKEDRRKLLITDVFPLSSKKDNKIWGYAVQTRSVGSGKASRLTIRSSVYAKAPIKRFDIIYAKELEKNRSGYWYLLDYDLIA
jgi:DNA polymerase-3 subunit alpha